MPSTWLDFCIRLDGPKEKQGYPGVSSRTLSEIEGEVDHSTEGPLSAALGELQKLERQASWHFTVPKSGPPLQHYPLEAITWHTGLPGDRRTDTSLVGNVTLIGIEHVDWPDNILNDNQLYWSIKLTKAFRRLCPLIAANPPALRVNLWEHNWLSPTSCPSGLIPWAKKLAAFSTKENDMPFLFHNAAGTYWEMCPGGFKKAIVFPALQAYAEARGQNQTPVVDVLLPDSIIGDIPDLPLAGGVDLSAIAKAVRAEFETDPLK